MKPKSHLPLHEAVPERATPRDANQSPRRARAIRSLALWLFCGLTCLYILIGGGHIYTPDGVVMFKVSQSLLQGKLHIEQIGNWPGFGVYAVRDRMTGEERYYAKYGLGQSLAAVPLVALGTGLAELAGEPERSLFDTPASGARSRWYLSSADSWPTPMQSFTASWLNALVTAAWVAVLFLVGCELKFGIRASSAMALLAGLATPLTHYAQTFFSEPLSGFAYLLYFWLILVARRSRWEKKYLLMAGLALGWVALTKIVLAVLWLPAGIYFMLLLAPSPGEESPRPAGRLLLLARRTWPLVLSMTIPLAAMAWYNFARFGTPLETGYGGEVTRWSTPFLEGLSGLLFSSGRGLLWYMPLLFASAVCLWSFARRCPREAVFCALSLTALLLLYAKWYMWEGGWCWGPRFLVPVLPLLLLPLGASLASFPRWPASARLLFACLLLCAGVVTINGLLVNYTDFYGTMQNFYGLNRDAFLQSGVTSYYDLLRWKWNFSPLLAYWRFPVKDYFLLPHTLARPGIVLSMYILAGTGLLVAWGMIIRSMASRRWME